MTVGDHPSQLINRAAVLPGFVLFLGLIPLAGFSAFMPLYADEQLDIGAGPIFLLYGVLILAVRIFGARIPDRLGGRRSASIALVLAAIGIAIMAIWPTVPGLVVGTVVFAVGMSLMYPALLLLALQSASDADRASVVGTFSSFFDLSQGVGAFICGAVAAATGNRGAFATGAIAAVAGFIVLRSAGGTALRRAARATALSGGGARRRSSRTDDARIVLVVLARRVGDAPPSRSTSGGPEATWRRRRSGVARAVRSGRSSVAPTNSRRSSRR